MKPGGMIGFRWVVSIYGCVLPHEVYVPGYGHCMKISTLVEELKEQKLWEKKP